MEFKDNVPQTKWQLYRYGRSMQRGVNGESFQKYKSMLFNNENTADFSTLLHQIETHVTEQNTLDGAEANEIEENDFFGMEFGQINWTNILGDEDSDKLAYDNADITEDEGLRILMSMRNKTKISDAAFGHVLSAIDQLLPRGHKLPSSNFLFRQKIGASDIDIIEHQFCRAHRVYVGVKTSNEVCGACEDDGMDSSFERFFTFDLIKTWRSLLEDKRVQMLIREGIPKDQLGIGKSRRFQEVHVEDADYTMTFFMDALRVSNSKSNTQSVTIISFVCDQIPPPHRFNFARPAMIYVGEVSVDSNILLKPFIDQCIELSECGLKHAASDDGGDFITSRVRTMACISDAKAKCEIQGFRQYNARDCPCTTCYDRGEKREKGTSYTVFPFTYNSIGAKKRTDEQTRIDARAALELLESNASSTDKEKGVNGVKFPSELLRLPRGDFDSIRSVVHDIMHIVIGVGGQLLDILLEEDIRVLAYYEQYKVSSKFDSKRDRIVSKQQSNILSEAMKEILYPSHVNRIPDHLCYHKQYKASAVLHLFLYSFPFVFKRREPHIACVIDQPFRRLILGFSNALHLLLADKLSPGFSAHQTTEKRHDVASCLINEFLHSSTLTLGQSRMTYNFHQLLHLLDNYLDFGPLYDICAFPHESNLGALRSMVHGKNIHVIDKEICNKFATYQCLAQKLSSCENRKRVRLTGRAHETTLLSDSALQLLKDYLASLSQLTGSSVKVFKRGYLPNGFLVHTAGLSSHETSRSDCFYLLKNGTVGEIRYLIEVCEGDQRLILAIVNVVGTKENAFPWAIEYERKSIEVEYPQFFVKKPVSAQKLCVVPIHHLSQPVLVMHNDVCATQYMSTSFFMSKN